MVNSVRCPSEWSLRDWYRAKMHSSLRFAQDDNYQGRAND